jgi:hypothetical protein
MWRSLPNEVILVAVYEQFLASGIYSDCDNVIVTPAQYLGEPLENYHKGAVLSALAGAWECRPEEILIRNPTEAEPGFNRPLAAIVLKNPATPELNG